MLLLYTPCIVFCSTAWHSQPYSLGSYTLLGVGGQPTHIEKVAEPLFQKPNNRTVRNATKLLSTNPGFKLKYWMYSTFQPVVAFAGEHCHPSFYSTVHGAYLSGKSAAQFYLNVAATEAASLGTRDPGESEEVRYPFEPQDIGLLRGLRKQLQIVCLLVSGL